MIFKPRADKALKGGGPDRSAPAAEASGRKAPSRRARALLYALLGAAFLADSVQVAGILLRDGLEGRTSPTRPDALLTAIGALAPKAHEENHLGASRGFGVAEVEIGELPPGGHESTSGESPAPPSHGSATHEVKAGPVGHAQPGRAGNHAGESPKTVKETAKAPQKAAAKGKPSPAHGVANSAPEPKGKADKAKETPAKAAPKAKSAEQSGKAPLPHPPEAKPAKQAEAAQTGAHQPTPAPPPPQPHPPESKASAPASAKVAPPAPPSTREEVQPPAPQKPSAPPKASGKARFRADPSGGFAVAVGAFNSQRLAGMMEQRLDELGFPHVRISSMKEAEGYTLTLSAASEAVLNQARKALADNGYKLERTPEGYLSKFFTEDEALKAKTIGERGGAQATVKKSSGQTPLWRILVGPTTSENASKAQEVLKAEGIDCVTVRYKP